MAVCPEEATISKLLVEANIRPPAHYIRTCVHVRAYTYSVSQFKRNMRLCMRPTEAYVRVHVCAYSYCVRQFKRNMRPTEGVRQGLSNSPRMTFT